MGGEGAKICSKWPTELRLGQLEPYILKIRSSKDFGLESRPWTEL